MRVDAKLAKALQSIMESLDSLQRELGEQTVSLSDEIGSLSSKIDNLISGFDDEDDWSCAINSPESHPGSIEDKLKGAEISNSRDAEKHSANSMWFAVILLLAGLLLFVALFLVLFIQVSRDGACFGAATLATLALFALAGCFLVYKAACLVNVAESRRPRR